MSKEKNATYDKCAAIIMDRAGLYFPAPWEGDLDDEERNKYDALSAVIDHLRDKHARIVEESRCMGGNDATDIAARIRRGN